MKYPKIITKKLGITQSIANS